MDESGPVFLHLDDESAVRNLVRRLIQRIGVRLTVVEVGTPQEYVATLERLVVGARPVVAIMTCDPELEDLVDRGESVLGRGFPRTAAPGGIQLRAVPWFVGPMGCDRGRARAEARGATWLSIPVPSEEIARTLHAGVSALAQKIKADLEPNPWAAMVVGEACIGPAHVVQESLLEVERIALEFEVGITAWSSREHRPGPQRRG
ncbi:MAG: hypothetical protein KC933_00915 [Myxococcales bacterium]|nr:hypothetical protein [Myxococcales bacterium]MCB9648575.1 hypothetical protein [Deltaproteobacteria bacterium]